MAEAVRLWSMWPRISWAAAAASPSTTSRDELVVLLKSRVRGSSPGGQLEPEAAVAVGLVPQVVEDSDDDVVVRGEVQGAVERAVGARVPSSPHSRVTGISSRRRPASGDVVVGAALGGQRDGGGSRASRTSNSWRASCELDLGDPGVAVGVEVDEPSPLSRRMASRSGVMLIRICSASSYWASREPAGSEPPEDPLAEFGVGDVALAGEEVGDPCHVRPVSFLSGAVPDPLDTSQRTSSL